jgi:riboflavin kinase/FMN adenylyltransferase
MRIYRHLDEVCGRENGCVLAVGNFDGLHLGHREIFSRAREMADDLKAPFAILTFTEHTAARVRPGEEPPILMSVGDRLEMAGEMGVDAALLFPFDETFAALTPERFVRQVLGDCLGVSGVVAGSGWRFGRERAGDMTLMEKLGLKQGFRVASVAPLVLEGLPVSSTRIRRVLSRGNVELAARLLGRQHAVSGEVVHGEGRGRELGFPTVNLDCHNLMLPAMGVYAAAYEAGSARGAAAVNIGVRPTFGPAIGEAESTMEAHLVDLNRDLYGREVRISFLARLRSEMPFSDAEKLIDNIRRDVDRTVEIYQAWRSEAR